MKLGITMLIHNKDDIHFVTEFPCFLGHPVWNQRGYIWNQRSYIWNQRGHIWNQRSYIWNQSGYVWNPLKKRPCGKCLLYSCKNNLSEHYYCTKID